MKISRLRLFGLRCFDDTGDVNLSDHCNVIVGQNNSGKSTILKAPLSLQGMPFSDPHDLRHGSSISGWQIKLTQVDSTDYLVKRASNSSEMGYSRYYRSTATDPNDVMTYVIGNDNPILSIDRPANKIVPFLAKRKAIIFDQNVSSQVQSRVTGRFEHLYSRIDLLATAGHPKHELFMQSVVDIVGIKITTKAAPNGKEAGFYFDDDNFVTLDRMGDGVAEMVALIVELSIERGKIFVLEEPETNIHPRGLKSLLNMIRLSSDQNQFLIATHSNVVVRELGGDPKNKVFRVYRDGDSPNDPSRIEEVDQNPTAHMAVLRELGYEFADFDLHEGWLFLEESSAETVIRDILIPTFAPELKGRLRTFSAGGVTNLEPSLAEFQRLIVFVHLQPAYEGRTWIRADGDEPGIRIIANIREKFAHLNEDTAATFSKQQFEEYYPDHFRDRSLDVLNIESKAERRFEKARLLQDVLAWTRENAMEARQAWEESASEQISLLRQISRSLGFS